MAKRSTKRSKRAPVEPSFLTQAGRRLLRLLLSFVAILGGLITSLLLQAIFSGIVRADEIADCTRGQQLDAACMAGHFNRYTREAQNAWAEGLRAMPPYARDIADDVNSTLEAITGRATVLRGIDAIPSFLAGFMGSASLTIARAQRVWGASDERASGQAQRWLRLGCSTVETGPSARDECAAYSVAFTLMSYCGNRLDGACVRAYLPLLQVQFQASRNAFVRAAERLNVRARLIEQCRAAARGVRGVCNPGFVPPSAALIDYLPVRLPPPSPVGAPQPGTVTQAGQGGGQAGGNGLNPQGQGRGRSSSGPGRGVGRRSGDGRGRSQTPPTLPPSEPVSVPPPPPEDTPREPSVPSQDPQPPRDLPPEPPSPDVPPNVPPGTPPQEGVPPPPDVEPAPVPEPERQPPPPPPTPPTPREPAPSPNRDPHRAARESLQELLENVETRGDGGDNCTTERMNRYDEIIAQAAETRDPRYRLSVAIPHPAYQGGAMTAEAARYLCDVTARHSENPAARALARAAVRLAVVFTDPDQDLAEVMQWAEWLENELGQLSQNSSVAGPNELRALHQYLSQLRARLTPESDSTFETARVTALGVSELTTRNSRSSEINQRFCGWLRAVNAADPGSASRFPRSMIACTGL